MRRTFLFLLFALAVVGCDSGPQPEAEKPVDGKVETSELKTVPSDSRTGGERDGDR